MENGDENTVTEFSVEQEEHFRARFEGYDLIDPEYLRWLEINHLDSIPADRHILVLAPESSADVSEDNPTLTDVFSFVQPSSPIPTTKCAQCCQNLGFYPNIRIFEHQFCLISICKLGILRFF